MQAPSTFGLMERQADDEQTVPLQGKKERCSKIETINIAPTLSGRQEEAFT